MTGLGGEELGKKEVAESPPVPCSLFPGLCLSFVLEQPV